MAEQAQEYRWTIKNGVDNESRKVHTQRVINPFFSDQYVDVERIDKLNGKIAAEQQQDYMWNFKNNDPPPQPYQAIGSDPQHLRYHYVRYCMNNNPSSDVWIDVELVDRYKIVSAYEQYQEYIFYLKHPEIDADSALSSATPDPYNPTLAQCDLSLPLVADSHAPWRFDPFQNPVNVHWEQTTESECGYKTFALTLNLEDSEDLTIPIVIWDDAIDVYEHLEPSQFVETWVLSGTIDMRHVDGPSTGVEGWTHTEWITLQPNQNLRDYSAGAAATSDAWWAGGGIEARPVYNLIFVCEPRDTA